MQLPSKRQILVIGAGPAGLMAAEQIAVAGHAVHVYDAMPSAGRKFLLAGKSGMNLSHAEEKNKLLQRYQPQHLSLLNAVKTFDAAAIRDWAKALGVETFVGSSGRVFPVDMKAAPLLRAWLHRLRAVGVTFHMRHKWTGWQQGKLEFQFEQERIIIEPDAVVFAMGGASWQRLGSDARWVPLLQEQGAEIAAFVPSNCGFELSWSPFFKEKFAGTPLMNVVASLSTRDGITHTRQGQFVITEHGIEGSLIYALSAKIREEIPRHGSAILCIDLMPGRTIEQVYETIATSRGSKSLSSHLKSKLKLHAVHLALLHEQLNKAQLDDMRVVANTLKALPLNIERARPIDEAISSAGGLRFDQLDAHLMWLSKPGYFCAGEMLDWEAPTGGYLLTACFATGHLAGRGVIEYLQKKVESSV